MEFRKLPSLSRLWRDMTVTEKLDGTQSTIIFEMYPTDLESSSVDALIAEDGTIWQVGAQSKNRLLYPGKQTDNYGFAEWVFKYRYELFELLGPGRHSGEWWGQGIQRNYGLEYRAFSLFNPRKLGNLSQWTGGVLVGSVPVLYEGPWSDWEIENAALRLRRDGSEAVPGFMKPEGVVVYHQHSGHSYKFTIDNNDKHKWEDLEGWEDEV